MRIDRVQRLTMSQPDHRRRWGGRALSCRALRGLGMHRSGLRGRRAQRRAWSPAFLARLIVSVALPVLGLTACDVVDGAPPPTALVTSAGLSIASSSIEGGAHAGQGAVRIEFDRSLDLRSVGARSVRISHDGGRRVRRVRVWATDRTLFVAPAPGVKFPAGSELLLRIEGGGSPRALRAEDGTALDSRYEIRFRTRRRRHADLTAPRFVGSLPEAGARDVKPGSHVQLRFDEPLSRASVRSGAGVVLRVDGVVRPAKLRLSPDLMRLVVRPRRPFPPGANVVVDVRPGLLDLAGNPAQRALVKFSVEATRLHELQENFVTTDTSDGAATTGGWSPSDAPGYLVARAGRVRWSPTEGDDWDAEFPETDSLRFQVVFPGDSAPTGAASALRLTLRGAVPGDTLTAVAVAAGPTNLLRADPTFFGNRAASDLMLVVHPDDAFDVEVEVDDDGVAVVEIPFDVPVAVRRGESLLLEVELSVPASVRLAATEDLGGLALVEHLGGALLPAVELLVTGVPPQARSTWYDSGVVNPGWREARIVGTAASEDPGYVVEFQTAAATPDGFADADRSSDWAPALTSLPALRFVRFRVEFGGLGGTGGGPRIDRVVLPYED